MTGRWATGAEALVGMWTMRLWRAGGHVRVEARESLERAYCWNWERERAHVGQLKHYMYMIAIVALAGSEVVSDKCGHGGWWWRRRMTVWKCRCRQAVCAGQ